MNTLFINGKSAMRRRIHGNVCYSKHLILEINYLTLTWRCIKEMYFLIIVCTQHQQEIFSGRASSACSCSPKHFSHDCDVIQSCNEEHERGILLDIQRQVVFYNNVWRT